MDNDTNDPTEIEVEWCDWDFEFKCPKKWERLKTTNDPDVRFCDTCSKNVYFVKTSEELAEKAKENKCIAMLKSDPDSELMELGIIDCPDGHI